MEYHLSSYHQFRIFYFWNWNTQCKQFIFNPYDITFTFITINNNSEIIGTGKKTYASGVTINNNNGTLGGGEHILSNGAILNSITSTIISSTTLTNHGVFNLQSGNISGVSNNTFFVNESDGIVNVNAPATNQWSNLNFTNKGSFNKVSNTITRFNNNFGTGTFINDVGVTLSIAAGQEIQFLNTATLNGTISNSGILSFNALCTLNGSLINNGTWNITSPPTINLGSSISGTGILNVNNSFAIPYDITFTFITINNLSEIIGTGKKTYSNGVTINNTNGTLGGGEHILSNGAILNSITSTIISSTTLTNHGVFNLQSGNVSGVSNNTFFVTENDGIVNVNAPGTNQWSNLNFTNKGLFNKVSNTITRFNNNFGTGNFINDVGVTLSIAAGQEIQFLNTATLNGTISNSGILSFNALCTLNGSLVNNGTWNITSAPTINLGSAISGTGILNVNNSFSIPYDITFNFNTINNISEIIGTGKKTYASGVTINNNNGTLGGGEHILSNGAILNSITFTIISSTTLTNHGVFNLQSGNISGVSNNTFFVNESDGIVNVNAPATNQWSNLNFTNKGLFNKVSNTITRFK
ncbi:MAG: hypothetical protein IPN72_15065 [Saprospiraceae bacterium]|nr:hypothetical protein [Saprospiraceae bacterium]